MRNKNNLVDKKIEDNKDWSDIDLKALSKSKTESKGKRDVQSSILKKTAKSAKNSEKITHKNQKNEKTFDFSAYKVTTHNMRKVLPIYAKHKGLLAITMVFMICSGVLGILMPIYSANALAFLASGEFELAIKNIIIMCSLGAFKIVSNAFDEYFYVKVNLKLRYELTNKVIGAINSTKMSKLDETSLGSLSDRLSTDVNSVSDVYLDMMNLVFSILTNVVFLCYIAYLNFYLFLILLAYVLVLYVVCTIRSRIWIRGRKIVKRAKDTARSAYFEQIVGIRDVKLLNIESEVTNFSNKKLASALKIEQSLNNKRNVIRRIQTFISVIFELTFLLIGITFVQKGWIFLAGLLVIYAYYGRVESLVTFISQFKEFKAEGEIAATRIFEVIEDFEKETYGSEKLENFSGNIKLDNVSFAYSKNNEVLKDVSLEFKPGEITAIVGKSGSGKTTILNIISKLYNVSKGKILFDNKNINSLSEDAIRNSIGEVSQSPYIFNASIRQNLLFVKPDASEEEIVKVLKDAQIYDDIMKMKGGIDTEIGENGIKLSGGQKQRVAIARLLLRGCKVIVFDEATSALDNRRQDKIVDLLQKIKKDKTIIIVAHRLSTIVNSDIIYMIEDGRVIASGTHKNLMKDCREYQELYLLEEKSAENK